MKTILLIFLGGGLGSVCRYGLSRWLNTSFLFPLGTFLVNILGSLLIGFILSYALKANATSGPMVLFLTVGFCGGFTTFSAFALENLSFLKNGDYTTFAIYTISSLLFSIASVFFGFWLAKSITLS